ncbi:sulfatase [Solirubrobacter sp. CPCC 204708]|uniref:Sulfatase n=1 Tax=Solirubrobacter deserti TaxID=2282478 RepID=A0ABT4RES2_9ACTN|nr:sulfatase [Solirubrobacter deserti]MBE2318578.1 sulfatase [Solirubrobacter deserti]MDA0137036.1 sulfatase [Solirubrobacter deserti]
MLARLVLALALLALAVPAPAHAQRPNIVFVLADDLSMDLVQYMPRVQAMMAEGASFERFVATNSLCCPSRASILTGRYSHSTGIFRNQPPDGGFEVFTRMEERSTFATSLQDAGYRTAMMGKYLNGYRPGSRFVPPGWTEWVVAGEAYESFNYNLLVKGLGPLPPQTVRHGRRASDYLTDVIARRGRQFIAESVRSGRPFLLKLAPYMPHAPFTPAPRDRDRFPGVKAPRGPLFDAAPLPGAPDWLPRDPLTPDEIARIDRDYRKRVQSVQAIDRMLGDLRAQLVELGVDENTYVVFASDNGFHMGERRLTAGKQGPWDHDIRVPLVVVGPGVTGGRVIDKLAANVDLRPTFEDLAGVRSPAHVEGRSLAPLLLQEPVLSWRDATLVEHHGPPHDASDPDAQDRLAGKPPSYAALRFDAALYVQYDNPKRAPEYYEHGTDPHEQHNLWPTLPEEQRERLARRLAQLRDCGGPDCRILDQGP